MLDWIDELPWALIALLCLTLGLAPYAPPHVYEKLQMLFQGRLDRPIDWFDLLLHSLPWVLLLLKTFRTLGR
jgi:hypothetical protein